MCVTVHDHAGMCSSTVFFIGQVYDRYSLTMTAAPWRESKNHIWREWRRSLGTPLGHKRKMVPVGELVGDLFWFKLVWSESGCHPGCSRSFLLTFQLIYILSTVFAVLWVKIQWYQRDGSNFEPTTGCPLYRKVCT